MPYLDFHFKDIFDKLTANYVDRKLIKPKKIKKNPNPNYEYGAVSGYAEVSCANTDTVSAVGQTGNVTVYGTNNKSVTFGTEIIEGGIFTVNYPLN